MYKKKFGQNFLINDTVAKKIINLLKIEGQNVLEIGPGNLSLSKHIVQQKPRKYIAVEIDEDIYIKTKSFFTKKSKAQIINTDALNIDETKYFGQESFIIISNLPFNISSALLIKWLKIKSNYNQINRMALMFQKELAQRIVAKVNSNKYGRLSVLTSAFFNSKIEIIVNKNNFFPVPKVDASVVVFEPHKFNKINKKNFKKLEDLTFLFFNSRRKKNKKKIHGIFNQEQIKRHNLDKYNDLRPENISPSVYYEMCSIKN